MDLLRRLLAYDAAERLLPEEALQHPFFRRTHEVSPTKQLSMPVEEIPIVQPHALDAPPYRVPGLPRRFDVWESCRRYAEIKRPGAFCEYVTGVEQRRHSDVS